MRALFVLLLAGCGGSPISASIINAARLDGGDVAFKVRYHDADANLGGGTAQIRDCRGAAIVTALDLPAIASDAAVQAHVAIEGELDLTLRPGAVASEALSPACAQLGVSAPPSGQAVFCIELVDRAGTRSNAACSEPIALAE